MFLINPFYFRFIIAVFLVSSVAFASKSKKKNNFENSGAVYDVSELVSDIKAIKVEFDEKTFLVKERKSRLQRGACNKCHGKSSKLGIRKSSKISSDTHKNIKLIHAAKQGMNCQTCHANPSVEDLKNPNNSDKIDINYAFLSCQGCHFNQVRDWAGGAHGKRVKIWANPRMIYNCTECHDPHDPSFKPRLPKIISTLPEKR